MTVTGQSGGNNNECMHLKTGVGPNVEILYQTAILLPAYGKISAIETAVILIPNSRFYVTTVIMLKLGYHKLYVLHC